MTATLPATTTALIMARIDRAKLRSAIDPLGTYHRRFLPEPEPESWLFGLELRVNELMPEGIIGCVDRAGNVLCLLDIRGDHARQGSGATPPGEPGRTLAADCRSQEIVVDEPEHGPP